MSHFPRLIVVCGLPGSGKTSHAKQVEKQQCAVRLCPDEWMSALHINLWDSEARDRIEQLQWKFAQELLARGQSVVIEWGTWARVERDTLRTGARQLGAAVELHVLDASLEVLYQRIRARGMESPPIELSELQAWSALFERPSVEELALFDAPLDADDGGSPGVSDAKADEHHEHAGPDTTRN